MLDKVPVFLASMLMLTTAACVSAKVEPLPAYEACVDRPPAVDEPRCVWVDEIDLKQLPTLVPYAFATATAREKEQAGDALRRACASVDPDVIVLRESDLDYGDSYISHSGGVGGGLKQLPPTYKRSYQATCYRLAPVQLGLRWDEIGLVQQVAESARKSGISIGDQIVSLADASVEYGESEATSPHLVKLMALKPGDQVMLVWMRPKIGRMQGSTTCQPNPPVGL